MKLLTLNTHSLQEENYEKKLDWFIEGILEERPDIIALQEVNQTADAELAGAELLEGQVPIPGSKPVRQDNHAAQVVYRLRQAGIDCSWAWLPIKLGYGKYDEGVAILSLGKKIGAAEAFPISKANTTTGAPALCWAYRWKAWMTGFTPSTWAGGTMQKSPSWNNGKE